MLEETSTPNPEQNKNSSDSNLNKWLRVFGEKVKSTFGPNRVIPETIEQAHLEAAEESINTSQEIQEYLNDKLLSSPVISNSGAKILIGGGALEFPNQSKPVSLGLPDHNFYIKYGSRAQESGKSLDPRKYVDLVVNDVEQQVSSQQIPSINYEFYPLREAVESILINNHKYELGIELDKEVRNIEEQVTKVLTSSENPLQMDSVVVDGVTIPRKTDYGSLRIFDTECYV